MIHRQSRTAAKGLAACGRDNYRCALCDSPRGIQIHHVIERTQGGTNEPQNLVTLCMYCHGVAHGSRFPELPDWMNAAEIHEACIEYVADYYAPDWYPFEGGGL